VANQAARNRLRGTIIEQNLHVRTQELWQGSDLQI
jgi:hypothetical protein